MTAPTHIQAHLFAQELTLKRAADDPGSDMLEKDYRGPESLF